MAIILVLLAILVMFALGFVLGWKASEAYLAAAEASRPVEGQYGDPEPEDAEDSPSLAPIESESDIERSLERHRRNDFRALMTLDRQVIRLQTGIVLQSEGPLFIAIRDTLAASHFNLSDPSSVYENSLRMGDIIGRNQGQWQILHARRTPPVNFSAETLERLYVSGYIAQVTQALVDRATAESRPLPAIPLQITPASAIFRGVNVRYSVGIHTGGDVGQRVVGTTNMDAPHPPPEERPRRSWQERLLVEDE